MILVVSKNWRPLFFVIIFILTSDTYSFNLDGNNDLNKLNNSTETYKVFRIFPRSWTDIDSLAALRKMSEDDEVSFSL